MGMTVALLFAAAFSADLPKVWMSAVWREPFEETVRLCAAQGVDVVEVQTRGTNVCARELAALRKYNVKGFTSCGYDPSKSTWGIAGRPPFKYERAVGIGGAYRGKAIDRTLYDFTPGPQDIIVEPPVYAKGQPYARKANGADGQVRTVRNGHYYGGGLAPTGEAEIIVPEKPFDGTPHLRIIPCEVLPAPDGETPENDTAVGLSGPEIDNRRLVRLKFDLTDCAGMMLDKVGIAVYWASDDGGEVWENGSGQLSVFSPLTLEKARAIGEWRMNQWKIVNGGEFPKDDIIAMRFGDEGFNVTGWLDSGACSFPLWGFSKSGRAAFASAAPGLVQPRTWGYPEVYGAAAYGHALYSYHKACAELTHAIVGGVKSVAPSVKVFRNTTRGGVWDECNEHDGTGQELLARELDFVHLDPYPAGRKYNSEVIPFDMGYMSGLSRRYGKPLFPWMQAHCYAPNGLGNITPSDLRQMWAQHMTFAPDGMIWLGFDLKPGSSGYEMTFPKGNPESWAYAKKMFAKVHAALPARKPVATLAVLRPYEVRAICCAQGAHNESWRNPADRILAEYVRAWSVDNGLYYDVFELPPSLGEAKRVVLSENIRKYSHVVSTVPWPGATVLGAGTEGTIMTAADMAALRKKFAMEVAVLNVARENGR